MVMLDLNLIMLTKYIKYFEIHLNKTSLFPIEQSKLILPVIRLNLMPIDFSNALPAWIIY